MNSEMKFVLVLSLCFLSLVLFSSLKENEHHIECSDGSCYGEYSGAEFVNGSDIAHQFSNHMSARVGDQLKHLFKRGLYSKVDFDQIEMRTEGMGSGQVVYYLKIPFIQVDEKCDAYTSFDHVGGWNHAPALEARKRQLQGALMDGEVLVISSLKITPEGLQEHWIQWKNKNTQSMCALQPEKY
jgi:hypothetical protein